MKKAFKWIGISLGSLVVLLLLFPFLFKSKVEEAVKKGINEQVNAQVDFSSVSLSVISTFPDFKLSINDLKVLNIGEFKGDTLLAADKISVELDLMSVINGEKYDIEEISFHHPKIHARVLADGRANWDIAKPSTPTAQEEKKEATKFALQLQRFEIKDAEILYEDAKQNLYAHIKDLNHELEGDFTQDVFDMETLTEIAALTVRKGGVSYLSKAALRLKADLNADMKAQKFTFKKNEFSINDLQLAFDGWVAMPDTNTIQTDFKFKTLQTEFKSILSLVPVVYSTQFSDIKTSGTLALDGFVKGNYTAKSLPAFQLKLLVDKASFQYPSVPKSAQNIHIDLLVNNPNGQPDATQIHLNKFHAELAQNPVDAELHVQTPISDPSIQAKVKADLNLASISDLLPLKAEEKVSGAIKADLSLKGRLSSLEKKQYDQFEALGFLSVKNVVYQSAQLKQATQLKELTLNFSPQFADLKMFDAQIGKSDLKVTGRIDNILHYALKGDLLKGNVVIQSKLIEANELMGMVPASGEASADTTSSALKVVEIPSNIDLSMNVQIGQVLYGKYDIKNVKGSLKVSNSVANLESVALDIIDGHIVLNGQYGTINPKRPNVAMGLQMQHFDVTKCYQTFNTVEKLAPIAKHIKGSFDMSVNFTAFLDEHMNPDLKSVNGKGKLQTHEIVIEGFEPINKLADAIKQPKYKKLSLKNLNPSFEIKDGRVFFDETTINIGSTTAKVKGSSGIDQSIDYVWAFDIPKSELGIASQAGAQLLDKMNKKTGTQLKMSEKLKIKVLMTGTVTKPIIKTDLASSANEVKEEVKTQVMDAVNQKKDEAIKQAKEKAKAEADRILSDAKAQSDRIKAEAQALADRSRSEGYAAADRLVQQASNPFTKKAAEIAAKKAKQEVDKKVNQILSEADARSNQILQNADREAKQKLQ